MGQLFIYMDNFKIKTTALAQPVKWLLLTQKVQCSDRRNWLLAVPEQKLGKFSALRQARIEGTRRGQ